jgi:hypothetical protein
LPDPDGPITAVNVPCGSETDTSCSARTALLPLPYTLLTPSRRTADTSPFKAGERFDDLRVNMPSTVRSTRPDGIGCRMEAQSDFRRSRSEHAGPTIKA